MGKKVSLFSFGFKYGAPTDANLLLDVRFLKNPYYDDKLRPYTGQNPAVAEFVLADKEAKKFMASLEPLLDFLCGNSQGDELRLAIGCTGGHHRSVAVVESLGRFLQKRQLNVEIFHRDIEKDSHS